jgi:hypothetical protein
LDLYSIMSDPKSRATRPKSAGSTRSQAESLRKRFLWAEVTDQEYDAIQQHCRKKGSSVSKFISDLLLQEASSAKTKQKQSVILRPKIQLTAKQQAKLELLARLHQKKSIGDYILDVLGPQLELQRLHAPLKTKMVRYYLSDEEHHAVMKHVAELGLSATNYAAMVALRAIRKETKRAK